MGLAGHIVLLARLWVCASAVPLGGTAALDMNYRLAYRTHTSGYDSSQVESRKTRTSSESFEGLLMLSDVVRRISKCFQRTNARDGLLPLGRMQKTSGCALFIIRNYILVDNFLICFNK